MRFVVVVCWIAFLVYFVESAKSIHVELKSTWKQTSLLAEASEFFADDQLFWEFVSKVKNTRPENDKQMYDKIIEVANELIPVEKIRLLKFALSTRHYSPLVVVFHRLGLEALSEVNYTTIPDAFVVNVKENGMEILTTTQQVEKAIQESNTAKFEKLEFDHSYSDNHGTHPMILYAKIGTQSFEDFHNLLSTAKNVYYIFRHFDSKSSATDVQDGVANEEAVHLMSLQGYGLELQIKNMEYSALDQKAKTEKKQEEEEEEESDDDREIEGIIFSTLKKKKPHLANELSMFKDMLLQTSSNQTKINIWDLKDIGVQAVQRIMQSSSKLALMQELAQNLPMLITSLSKLKFSNDLKNEIRRKQKILGDGTSSSISINGIKLDLEKITPFTLIDILRSEEKLISLLSSLGLDSQKIEEALLSTDPEFSKPRFDVWEDKRVSVFVDVEKDSRFSQLRQNLVEMLRPSFYGQPRFCRRNVFNALFVLDPSTKEGQDVLATTWSFFYNGYPIRMGFIFVDEKDLTTEEKSTEFVEVGLTGELKTRDAPKQQTIANKLLKVFEYIKEQKGDYQAISFLLRLRHGVASSNQLPESVLIKEFKAFAPSGKTYEEVIASEEYSKIINDNVAYLKNHGFTKAPFLLFNGMMYPAFNMFAAFQEEYPQIVRLIREGVLTDKDQNILSKLMEHYSAFKRYHPEIFDENQQFISVSPQNTVIRDLNYLENDEKQKEVKTFTHLLCTDLNTVAGLSTVLTALEHLESVTRFTSRVGVLHSGKPSPITRSFEALRHKKQILKSVLTTVKQELQKISNPSPQQVKEILQGALQQHQSELPAIQEVLNFEAADDVVTKSSSFCGAYNLRNALITNGRILKITEKQPFSVEDFANLERFDFENLRKLTKILNRVTPPKNLPSDLEHKWRSDLILGVSSTLSENAKERGKRDIIQNLQETKLSTIQLNQDTESIIKVVAIMNPLSIESQKFTPILRVLADHFKYKVTVHLNPQLDMTTFPTKSWYRYVIEPELRFDEKGKIAPPHALFEHLPTNQVLTLNPDVPETWLIETTYAPHDLDNIKLEDLGSKKVLFARYQLENIIITGSCFDLTTYQPPRGLQLTLGTRLEPVSSDTLVMSNFGYFQLKANPNIWTLNIASGRHRDIYQVNQYSISSYYDQKQLDNYKDTQSDDVKIYVTSFDGPFVFLRVNKREGKENVELLEDDVKEKKSSGILSKISSLISSSKDQEKNETVNIFSIASGHMYERLLKIMILSVIKHTKKAPVKFWFIKNYLSPQFKEFLPHMAKHYKFDYQLVSYKWPSWLHKQTQKYRTIWAYKVLFLDVLFPLNVSKIIFVDADQVARTDMSELFNMDLNGKALGYTPFCDSRKEMEGFRFWKTGYWLNHLRGKPYHISALYVVDIARFRKIYAGDAYRMIYDSLAKDPNSLSNLDQDLPNYAQHQIPIFSLPQEWLWCESWCDDESKKYAKTIDLCNNPMTKENKLDSARRIIPEWTAYDNEATEFQESLKKKGILKTLTQ